MVCPINLCHRRTSCKQVQCSIMEKTFFSLFNLLSFWFFYQQYSDFLVTKFPASLAKTYCLLRVSSQHLFLYIKAHSLSSTAYVYTYVLYSVIGYYHFINKYVYAPQCTQVMRLQFVVLVIWLHFWLLQFSGFFLNISYFV